MDLKSGDQFPQHWKLQLV